MEQPILKSFRQGVLTLAINNPERRNAWNAELERALRAALQAADADPETRVLILTGAGRTFCPGADAAALGRGQVAVSPVAESDDDLEQRYSYMLGLRKPLIAAINGAAAGVGLCLALYCDLRFMVDDARITTSFTRRGLVAEHGSAWMLPRLIGPMNAADLLLSGRVLTGREAAELGLVRALPGEGFMDAVQAYAADMALNCSPRSMAVVKAQLALALRQTLAQATARANAETAAAVREPDFAEGVAHFVERRAPQFPPLI